VIKWDFLEENANFHVFREFKKCKVPFIQFHAMEIPGVPAWNILD
jgi:hypothetical protein